MARGPAAGGGRWVEVAPERLDRWLDGFAERHGGATWSATPQAVTVAGADGSVATCAVPFPPLAVDPHGRYAGLVEHACSDRRVGVLLVRRGGHAAGVVDGARLVVSKVGSRPVAGRSAAGGWSQQRFARRRAGQARVAFAAAADVAARILLPEAEGLAAVVTGGDRAAVAEVLADDRLAPLRPLVADRFLDVPEPRLRVLEGTPARFRAVRIHLVDART